MATRQVQIHNEAVITVYLTNDGDPVTGITYDDVEIFYKKARTEPEELDVTSENFREIHSTFMPGLYEITIPPSVLDTAGEFLLLVRSVDTSSKPFDLEINRIYVKGQGDEPPVLMAIIPKGETHQGILKLREGERPLVGVEVTDVTLKAILPGGEEREITPELWEEVNPEELPGYYAYQTPEDFSEELGEVILNVWVAVERDLQQREVSIDTAGKNIHSIAFVDESLGWVGGGLEGSQPPLFLYTQDGGETWEDVADEFDYGLEWGFSVLHEMTVVQGDGGEPIRVYAYLKDDWGSYIAGAEFQNNGGLWEAGVKYERHQVWLDISTGIIHQQIGNNEYLWYAGTMSGGTEHGLEINKLSGNGSPRTNTSMPSEDSVKQIGFEVKGACENVKSPGIWVVGIDGDGKGIVAKVGVGAGANLGDIKGNDIEVGEVSMGLGNDIPPLHAVTSYGGGDTIWVGGAQGFVAKSEDAGLTWEVVEINSVDVVVKDIQIKEGVVWLLGEHTYEGVARVIRMTEEGSILSNLEMVAGSSEKSVVLPGSLLYTNENNEFLKKVSYAKDQVKGNVPGNLYQIVDFSGGSEQKGQGAKAPDAGSGVAQIKKGEPYKVLAKLRTESGTLLQGQGSLLDVVVVRGDGSIVKKEMQESDWEPIPYTGAPAFWAAQAEGKHLLHLDERDTGQEGDLLISIKAEDVLVAHNMPLPPGKKTISLKGVYISETTGNVWAAGSSEQESYVVRKEGQGGAWEIIKGVPTGGELTFIYAEEDDNVYTGDRNYLYHWDGAGWSVLSKPVGNVRKMRGAADGTIWAVYADGLSRGGVLRIEGGTVIEASSGKPYRDLHVTEDLVWASGGGRRITKYTKDSGGQWTTEEKGDAPGLFTGSDIYEYYIITFGEDDPNYGFVVMPDQGAYETFDGGVTWSSFPISYLPIDLRKGGAKAISPTELYLYDGKEGVFKYDGQNITKVRPGPGYVLPNDWTSHYIKEDLLAFASEHYVLLPGTVKEHDIRLQVVEDLGERILEVQEGLEAQRAILGEVGRVVERQADFDIPLAAEVSKGRPHNIKVRLEAEKGLIKGALAEDVGIRCVKPDGSVVILDAQEGNWGEVDSEEFPGLYTVQIPETVTGEEGEIILQISYQGTVVRWGEVQEVQQDDHLKAFGFRGEEGWVIGKRGEEGFWEPKQAVVYHTRDGGDTWEEEIFQNRTERGFSSATVAEIEVGNIGEMTTSYGVFIAITEEADGVAYLYMYDTMNREWERIEVYGVTSINAIAVQEAGGKYLLWVAGTYTKVFILDIMSDQYVDMEDKTPYDLGAVTWLDLYAAKQRGTRAFDVIIVGTEGAVVRYSYEENSSEYDYEDISAEIGAGSQNLNSVAFDPETETVGWIVGDGGFAVKTGDQGETWENVDLNTSEDLIRVDILEEGEVWVFGKEGLARCSTDGGQTWEIRDLQGEGLEATIGLGRELAFVVTQAGEVKRLAREAEEDTKTLRYNVVQAAQGGGGADLTEIESKLEAIITRLEGIEGADFDQAAASLVEIKDAISNINLSPVVTSLDEIRGTGFDKEKHSLVKIAESSGGGGGDLTEIENRLEAIEEMVIRVLGLSQENISITEQQYDGHNNLTSSVITTYANNLLDPEDPDNVIATYKMEAEYDENQRLSAYRIRRI